MTTEEIPVAQLLEPVVIVAARPGKPGEYTTDDIDALPDNGLRYELLDGMLAISRSQGVVHQRAVLQLVTRLGKACPNDLEVLPALTFRPTTQRSLLPDVLVLENAPRKSVECLLVVEVLSPATRTMDLILKREVYAESGVPSYWTFDPEDELLTVLELVDRHYVERARIEGRDAFDAELPFPVRLVPADLTRPNNRSGV
jgi:Uma2 family endonuclease